MMELDNSLVGVDLELYRTVLHNRMTPADRAQTAAVCPLDINFGATAQVSEHSCGLGVGKQPQCHAGMYATLSRKELTD
jgi:hypothetical protein